MQFKNTTKSSKKEATKAKLSTKTIWNVGDPVELLDQITSLPSSELRMDDLKELLLTLSNLTVVTALALRMNSRVTAVIWVLFVYS
jgi:hypothetical protein